MFSAADHHFSKSGFCRNWTKSADRADLGLRFYAGEKEGLLIGFFAGMLCDIFFADILGFHALVYMYIGFLNGKFCKIFYPEDIKLPLALITISDLSYGVICYVLLFLLRGD